MGSQIIAARLTVEGKKRSLSSPRAIFKAMYETEGLSLTEIASKLRVSKQAVAYWLKRLSISIRPAGRESVFEASIAKLGFQNDDAYFKARQGKTFEQMSEELEVTTTTIRRWYDAWVQRFAAAE